MTPDSVETSRLCHGSLSEPEDAARRCRCGFLLGHRTAPGWRTSHATASKNPVVSIRESPAHWDVTDTSAFLQQADRNVFGECKLPMDFLLGDAEVFVT